MTIAKLQNKVSCYENLGWLAVAEQPFEHLCNLMSCAREDTGVSQSEQIIAAKLFAIITDQGKTSAATTLFSSKDQVEALESVPWRDIEWYAHHPARAAISRMYSNRGFPDREGVEALERWAADAVGPAEAEKLFSYVSAMQRGRGLPDLSQLPDLKQRFVKSSCGAEQRSLADDIRKTVSLYQPAVSKPPRVKNRSIVVAGGKETTSPEIVTGTSANAALFTYRGIGYADYNEDAAVIGTQRSNNGKEIFFAGACDQAGGHKDRSRTGAASKEAADCLKTAAKAVALGTPPVEALKDAAMKAHERIMTLDRRYCTTFVGGVIANGQATIINSGDSAALLIGRDGSLKAQTTPHNLGDGYAKLYGDPNIGLRYSHVLTSSLGRMEVPQLDVYQWQVGKGDRLVFVSDGVLDANLKAQKEALSNGTPWTESAGAVTACAIAQIVSGAFSSVQACQGLIDYTKEQVRSGAGKKDNVTAVVVLVA